MIVGCVVNVTVKSVKLPIPPRYRVHNQKCSRDQWQVTICTRSREVEQKDNFVNTRSYSNRNISSQTRRNVVDHTVITYYMCFSTATRQRLPLSHFTFHANHTKNMFLMHILYKIEVFIWYTRRGNAHFNVPVGFASFCTQKREEFPPHSLHACLPPGRKFACNRSVLAVARCYRECRKV